MQTYDGLINRSKDEKLAKGILGVLFEDLTMEGFEYYGKDENGNVINPYVERDPIDLEKLHKELNKIQGPDVSLEIERFSTSNPAPKRNVQKDYFIKVIKEYAGFSDVKKDKLDEYISIIKKYLGDKDEYEYVTSEVREFVNRIKDIPNKLVNTLVRILNGKKDTNSLNYDEEQKLKNLFSAFNKLSVEVLGKSVKF